MGRLLFVRPADDSAAIEVANWGNSLRLLATSFQFDDVSGSAAARTNIQAKLSSATALLYFGHGTSTELIANKQCLIDASDLGTFTGPVVAIACYAALGLGATAGTSNSGMSAFLGFDDEVGIPLAMPFRMGLAVVDGLKCLLTSGHDLGCAAQQLRLEFDNARLDYKTQGLAWGMTPSDTRTAWLFAKSNRYSVQLFGQYASTL